MSETHATDDAPPGSIAAPPESNRMGWPCLLVKHDYLKDSILEFDEDQANLVFVDPPYNQGIAYADDYTGDIMTSERYAVLCERMIRQLVARAAPGATFWWMTPERHSDMVGPLLTSIVGPRMFKIIWRESFAQYQGNRGLTDDYRMIIVHRVGSEGTSRWNPDEFRVKSQRQLLGDKRANPAGRVPGRVWEFRRLQGTSVSRKKWHPTQLPPELLERIIRGWTNPNDLVIDGCVGSGSMGEMCKLLNRRFVGIDRSATYLRHLRKDLRKK